MFITVTCSSTIYKEGIFVFPRQWLRDKSQYNITHILPILFIAFLLFIKLFHQPTLMHNFLYSLTICLLHYYPRHVSSINMPIFRSKNCIHTASGIFALCKRLPSTLVESGLNVLGRQRRYQMLCEYNFSS